MLARVVFTDIVPAYKNTGAVVQRRCGICQKCLKVFLSALPVIGRSDAGRTFEKLAEDKLIAKI